MRIAFEHRYSWVSSCDSYINITVAGLKNIAVNRRKPVRRCKRHDPDDVLLIVSKIEDVAPVDRHNSDFITATSSSRVVLTDEVHRLEIGHCRVKCPTAFSETEQRSRLDQRGRDTISIEFRLNLAIDYALNSSSTRSTISDKSSSARPRESTLRIISSRSAIPAVSSPSVHSVGYTFEQIRQFHSHHPYNKCQLSFF